MQHWAFTAQYLKVALIFELAFSIKTGEVQKKKRSRECVLIAVNTGFYLSFVAFAISTLFYGNHVTMTAFYMV